jgi:hypothetical protein
MDEVTQTSRHPGKNTLKSWGMRERTSRLQIGAEGAARSALLIACATLAAEIGSIVINGLLNRRWPADWFIAIKVTALVGLGSFAVLFFYVLIRFRASGPSKAIAAHPFDQQSAPLAGFVAMEYYGLILNRTIFVFFQPEGLYGWTVKGPVTCIRPRYFETYADRLKDPGLIDYPEVVQRLARLMKGGFFIPRAEIVSAEIVRERKWGMGPVPHSGRIELRLATGKPRELILLGNVDAEAIQKRILG